MANDDLMQNFNEDGGNNLRKYLLIGGGLFVIFVVAIVASKFLFSSPKKEDTTVILPPDIKQNKKDTNLFNDIPIENDNDFKKPITDNTQPTQTQPTQTQQPVQQAQQVQNKPVSQPEQVHTPPQTTAPTPKPKVVTKPKPIVKKVKPKVIHKKEVRKIIRNYYIQVAAVTKTNPSKRFLRLITKNGFKYKIVEVNVKGMKVKRVLVGPFSRNELKPALKKVKAKISASAFVKRIK